MKFHDALLEGTLIRRYKRFLADVELGTNGEIVTAHTANTGSMLGCSIPGSNVWLSDSQNPKRKYPLSWELVEAEPGLMVGINTGLANTLVAEAIESRIIGELLGYSDIRREVRYGEENSRIDLLLQGQGRPPCYVEVKNVTLVNNGVAFFPDAVSERGAKHLWELTAMVKSGHRAVIFFCIQRSDAERFQPADDIDPVYGKTLRHAISQGVEALACEAKVSPDQINLRRPLPVVCP